MVQRALVLGNGFMAVVGTMYAFYIGTVVRSARCLM